MDWVQVTPSVTLKNPTVEKVALNYYCFPPYFPN